MNGGRWGKNLVTVSFYNGGGNMVKLGRPTDHCQIAQNTGFSETFSFSKITFWKKEKTLSSLNNYSTSLLSTGITFQDKGKYSAQYNYSILQLKYFFPN